MSRIRPPRPLSVSAAVASRRGVVYQQLLKASSALPKLANALSALPDVSPAAWATV